MKQGMSWGEEEEAEFEAQSESSLCTWPRRHHEATGRTNSRKSTSAACESEVTSQFRNKYFKHFKDG